MRRRFASDRALDEPGLSSLTETSEKAGASPALSLVHPEGFEPTTPCSEDKCSNPLSYGCTREIIAFFKIRVIRYQLEVGFYAVYLTRFHKLSYI